MRKFRQITILFFVFSLFFLGAQNTSLDEENQEFLTLWDGVEGVCSKGFEKPATASQESWDAVQPYLLPYHHPVRKVLDGIFSSSRPLLSSKNMRKAGFFNFTPSDKGVIVSGHPRLRGYLIKAYLDTCYLTEWKLWIQRIVGVNQISESIEQLGYSSIMKAPKKWIYALPSSQPPPSGNEYYPKHYVLVVQDMGIYSPASNEHHWHNRVNRSFLNAFYKIVMVNGLVDSYYVDNSPFCFDGKIAFLDTEHYNADLAQFPDRQSILMQYLSSDMRQYWEQLILNGGPP